MNGRAPVVFDRKRRNAVVSEQHGRGHPHQAAADDQDGYLEVGHS
jgi:hypothetical protein